MKKIELLCIVAGFCYGTVVTLGKETNVKEKVLKESIGEQLLKSGNAKELQVVVVEKDSNSDKNVKALEEDIQKKDEKISDLEAKVEKLQKENGAAADDGKSLVKATKPFKLFEGEENEVSIKSGEVLSLQKELAAKLKDESKVSFVEIKSY